MTEKENENDIQKHVPESITLLGLENFALMNRLVVKKCLEDFLRNKES